MHDNIGAQLTFIGSPLKDLFISPKIVRKYIENIYQKIEIHSKLEAVQKAVKTGLSMDNEGFSEKNFEYLLSFQ